MPSISLTQPTALTVITAGLHATNYNALSSLLNGGLDNANIAAAANIVPTKLLLPGGTTTFLRGDGTFAAPPSTSIGTSLPGSPTDGQHAILVDSLTTPTYAWEFRHVSGISDAYKWVFIGGAAVLIEVTASETTSSTTYANLSGGATGPSFTLPVAGIYEVGIGMRHVVNGSNQTAVMSYDIGGTAAVDADSVRATFFGQNNYVQRARQKTIATAAALVAKYKVDTGGTSTIDLRWMRITPVRIG